MLLPHMEVMQKGLTMAKELMTKDANISIEESLVDLVASLEIQIQSLEVERNNWDSALAMIMQVHKAFLDKHTLSVTP